MKASAVRALRQALANFPRAILAHTPTPLEQLTGLPQAADDLKTCAVHVKRDDCTGLAMGGNKARQLEFYLGEAIGQGCDAVFSTGAVQSNYMRMLAAAAAKLGLECHIQLEDRVDNSSLEYRYSGNVLLNQLFGAHLHRYPVGEDENGADQSLHSLAERIKAGGKKPYIIPLGGGHAPTGALGYAVAALELARQIERRHLPIDLIIVGSGSGMTHAGLLVGLKMLRVNIPVLGACVRRDAQAQHPRVLERCQKLAAMLGQPGIVSVDDVRLDDTALAPGYGQASPQVKADMRLLASHAGLLTDPVYSGKAFSCAFNLIRNRDENFKHIVVIHTGGTPALFAYREEVLSGTA